MYRVTTVWTGTYVVGGGITRIYFDSAGGTAQDAADSVKALWTSIKDCYSLALTATVQTGVETIDPANGQIESLTAVTGGAVVGNDDGAAHPPQCQGILQLRTGVYQDGREIRGRIYVPGLTISTWSNGNYVTGKRTILEAGLAGIIADVDAVLVVWSREREAYTNSAGESVPHRDGSMAVVTAGALPAKTAVLRSRRD